jgi:hypothetical protein
MINPFLKGLKLSLLLLSAVYPESFYKYVVFVNIVQKRPKRAFYRENRGHFLAKITNKIA